ncbi:vesicular glutamate transporter 2 [Plakobranchus ocellatus]|uniref:Vesicular glutamate transporter 2 n=1 Tax=Plakobranchus ocellatus TaxID=259542 RepID=A0AAV4DD79_9GAST|nr:vesicular glutamate transporter 2 [Plakobranchus ocellatus]
MLRIEGKNYSTRSSLDLTATRRSKPVNSGGVYLSPAVASFSTGATICYVSWDSIMYITGSLGVVWALLWFLVVYPSPDQARIGEEEQRLLWEQMERARQEATNRQSILQLPWKKFFTSLPVLAIWVASFCRNFIFAMLISEVPQYFKDSYGLSTATIGLLAAAPHLCMVIFMSFSSVIFDMLVKKRVLSMTWIRKIAQGTGYGIQGACMLAIAFTDDYIWSCVLLCVGAAFSGCAISGFQTNPLDLAPEYAGPLVGISRTGMLGSIISTALASQIPGRSKTQQSWNCMFIIGGALHLAGVVFYLIFASGERQPWAPSYVPNEPDNDRQGAYDDHFANEPHASETDPLFPSQNGAQVKYNSINNEPTYGQNMSVNSCDKYSGPVF